MFNDKESNRFWQKVSKEGIVVSVELGNCWEWLVSTKSTGYGQFYFRGRSRPTHRLVYQELIGEIPEGLWVLHRCDNRICVRPSHLYLGNHTTNMEDMVKRYRMPRGENQVSHKLTVLEVLSIREEYSIGKVSFTSLAKRYLVARTTISRCIRKEKWSTVE